MLIGVITVRRAGFHPNARLAQAAAQRGHRVKLLHPYRLLSEIRGGEAGLVSPDQAETPRVVLPRVGAEISDYTLALLTHLELMGVALAATPRAVALARHKFLALQALTRAGLPAPDTLLVNTWTGLEQAAARLGGYPVVAKTPSGGQGLGVMLLKDRATAELAARFRLRARRGLLIQRFIPPQDRRDLRILVVGGRMVGAMSLRPERGDFRANFHLTGRAEFIEPSREQVELAQAAARALGLGVAGVDMIIDAQGRPWIMEVNFSPGFRGLEQASGRDIAGAMVDYLADLAP